MLIPWLDDCSFILTLVNPSCHYTTPPLKATITVKSSTLPGGNLKGPKTLRWSLIVHVNDHGTGNHPLDRRTRSGESF
jgi:hypothetical protein